MSSSGGPKNVDSKLAAQRQELEKRRQGQFFVAMAVSVRAWLLHTMVLLHCRCMHAGVHCAHIHLLTSAHKVSRVAPWVAAVLERKKMIEKGLDPARTAAAPAAATKKEPENAGGCDSGLVREYTCVYAYVRSESNINT